MTSPPHSAKPVNVNQEETPGASLFHRASVALETRMPRSFPRRKEKYPEQEPTSPVVGSPLAPMGDISSPPLSTSWKESSHLGESTMEDIYRATTTESVLSTGGPSLSNDMDDYCLDVAVGYGSSAVVYKAQHKPTQQVVAIKIIDLDRFERRQIDELRRETQVMSLSKHPNVLPVWAAFVEGSKLHMVTPYLLGGSCLDIIKSGFRKGLDEFSIVLILKQTLQGLDYIHRTGHIHRDVKAGNLLIDNQGVVKLADFGVSSSLTDTVGDERRGARMTFVGTPCWMAPEVMEQKAYDARADIWSLGITALELANGRAPLADLPALKVLMVTLAQPPPTLNRDTTHHKYTRQFKDMIDSCLQKQPSKRPAAQKVLQHPFFRPARKVRGYSHLVQTLLRRVPVLEKREHRPKEYPKETFSRGVSWDFSLVPTPQHEGHADYFADVAEGVNSAHLSESNQQEASETDPLTSKLFKTAPLSISTTATAANGAGSHNVDTVPRNPSPQPVSATAGDGNAVGGGGANFKVGRFSVSTTGMSGPGNTSGPTPAMSGEGAVYSALSSPMVSMAGSGVYPRSMGEIEPLESREGGNVGGQSGNRRGRFAVSKPTVPEATTSAPSDIGHSPVPLNRRITDPEMVSSAVTETPKDELTRALVAQLEVLQRHNQDQTNLLRRLWSLIPPTTSPSSTGAALTGPDTTGGDPAGSAELSDEPTTQKQSALTREESTQSEKPTTPDFVELVTNLQTILRDLTVENARLREENASLRAGLDQ
ncbi:hypothetical protein IWQ62_001662 [Dispira parvispora]|uniref:Protein kinase domain-containing protein n=1 Tax=Dispira parvispora TaxID=1520584 RepID=A0A9W8AS18_9FUNG|nr:hypothetical protein IWQ62_001662 [Dispira parvispora]